MNQTKKRLSIINLAISMTDIETIQLQILKLGLLKSDEAIQEIIAALQSENYARAQGLITAYIESDHEEVLQRTSQKEKEKAVVDAFDLFEDESQSDSDMEVIDLDEMMQFHNEATRPQTKKVQDHDFDTLLNLDTEEIMADNIRIDLTHKKENEDFWIEEEKIELDNQEVPRDTFFDQETETVPSEESEGKSEEVREVFEIKPMDEIFEEKLPAQNSPFAKREKAEDIYEILSTEEEDKKPEKTVLDEEKTATDYQTIPYIDQKLKNMQVQYPPAEETLEHFDSVNALLLKISNDGYSEETIEAIMKTIDEITPDRKDEAAQLMLIAGATESKYAQFRLARALFKGEILQKNLPEAFTIINRLAVNDDYPEAICDLAQFYEYGIGIAKDKKKAEQLYREAMEEGIQRAAAHYERLKKENKGLFSFFKK